MSLMQMREASGATWTDAWIAAFAVQAGLQLVTFDKGMRRWPDLQVGLLEP